MSEQWQPETLAIRGGREISDYQEHTQALFMTSSFTYQTAEEAEQLFSGAQDGFTYSRTANPTVRAFEQRMALLENAEKGLATSSGMAAIQAVLLTFLKSGDHVVASRSLFGSTMGLMNHILTRYGIEISFVELSDEQAWTKAIRANTKVFFLETPSNPLGEIADINALSLLAKAHQILLIVDNCFCSPAIQQPIALGADLSVSSATKLIDGHGRALGGIICGSAALIDEVHTHVRTSGEVLSPFNAWLLLSGLDTLFVRTEKECSNALELAKWLEGHALVSKVYYGGLASHPQHQLATKQQSAYGAVLAFEVNGGQKEAWKVIDSVNLFSRTGNLGDVKSTITHPYTTTHGKVSVADKKEANILPNLLRLSIGLEHIDDLKKDLDQALSQI